MQITGSVPILVEKDCLTICEVSHLHKEMLLSTNKEKEGNGVKLRSRCEQDKVTTTLRQGAEMPQWFKTLKAKSRKQHHAFPFPQVKLTMDHLAWC